jgi:Carboxypeptidase regulatory-like domain
MIARRGIAVAATLAIYGCGSATPAGPTLVVTPTYSVTGAVHDVSRSGAPLVGAQVSVTDGSFVGASGVTDSEGVFRLFALGGTFHLRITKDGYVPVTLTVGPLAGDTIVTADVTRTALAVSGRVTEAAPTESVPVAGATLKILDGPDAGRTLASNGDGAFVFENVTATFSMLVQAAGYQDVTRTINPVTDTTVLIPLRPVPSMVSEIIGTPQGPRRPPTSFFRNVHNPGTIVVRDFYFYYSLDPDNPPTRTIEIWSGGRLVAAGSVNRQQWFGIALEARVEAGARYEIRLSGGAWGAITILSPN